MFFEIAELNNHLKNDKCTAALNHREILMNAKKLYKPV